MKNLFWLCIAVVLCYCFFKYENYKDIEHYKTKRFIYTHSKLVNKAQELRYDDTNNYFNYLISNQLLHEELSQLGNDKHKFRGKSIYDVCIVDSSKDFLLDQSTGESCISESPMSKPFKGGGFVYYPKDKLLRLNIKLKNGVLKGEQYRITELGLDASTSTLKAFEINYLKRFNLTLEPAYWHLDYNKLKFKESHLNDIRNFKDKS